MSSRVVRVDPQGNVVDFGNTDVQDPAKAVALAQVRGANRVLSHAVSGRLSSSGGVAQIKTFLAVPPFVDEETATGPLGPTIATLNASLDLVTDGLAAIFTDLNAVAAVLGIPQVTYGGGGSAASPIAAITGAGSAADVQNLASEANPARIAINTNMHTAASLFNKIAVATGHEPVNIETSPYRQPPPDTYGSGGTGSGGGTSTGGSGIAFGEESPVTDPTPLIDDSMTDGGGGSIGVTKAAWDTALDTWRNNIETLATRLAVITNSVVALTDSSGGTADTAIQEIEAFPADVSVGGGTGTDDTELEAAAAVVQLNVALLFAKANELSAGHGLSTLTYNGGGAVANDTLEAVDDTLSTATTGPVKTEMDAWATRLNEAFDAVTARVNELAAYYGLDTIDRLVVTSQFPFDNPVNPQQEQSSMQSGTRFITTGEDGSGTIPATFAANATGQPDTVVEARLDAASDNIATIAAKINQVRLAMAAPLVRFV